MTSPSSGLTSHLEQLTALFRTDAHRVARALALADNDVDRASMLLLDELLPGGGGGGGSEGAHPRSPASVVKTEGCAPMKQESLSTKAEMSVAAACKYTFEMLFSCKDDDRFVTCDAGEAPRCVKCGRDIAEHNEASHRRSNSPYAPPFRYRPPSHAPPPFDSRSVRSHSFSSATTRTRSCSLDREAESHTHAAGNSSNASGAVASSSSSSVSRGVASSSSSSVSRGLVVPSPPPLERVTDGNVDSCRGGVKRRFRDSAPSDISQGSSAVLDSLGTSGEKRRRPLESHNDVSRSNDVTVRVDRVARQRSPSDSATDIAPNSGGGGATGHADSSASQRGAPGGEQKRRRSADSPSVVSNSDSGSSNDATPGQKRRRLVASSSGEIVPIPSSLPRAFAHSQSHPTSGSSSHLTTTSRGIKRSRGESPKASSSADSFGGLRRTGIREGIQRSSNEEARGPSRGGGGGQRIVYDLTGHTELDQTPRGATPRSPSEAASDCLKTRAAAGAGAGAGANVPGAGAGAAVVAAAVGGGASVGGADAAPPPAAPASGDAGNRAKATTVSAPSSSSLSSRTPVPLKSSSSSDHPAVTDTRATAPQRTPATAHQSTPATIPRSTPATASRSTPATAPHGTPATASRSTPATAPHGTPATASQSTPATAHQSTPATAPRSTPATAPHGTPAAAPQSTPAAPKFSTCQRTCWRCVHPERLKLKANMTKNLKRKLKRCQGPILLPTRVLNPSDEAYEKAMRTLDEAQVAKKFLMFGGKLENRHRKRLAKEVPARKKEKLTQEQAAAFDVAENRRIYELDKESANAEFACAAAHVATILHAAAAADEADGEEEPFEWTYAPPGQDFIDGEMKADGLSVEAPQDGGSEDTIANAAVSSNAVVSSNVANAAAPSNVVQGRRVRRARGRKRRKQREKDAASKAEADGKKQRKEDAASEAERKQQRKEDAASEAEGRKQRKEDPSAEAERKQQRKEDAAAEADGCARGSNAEGGPAPNVPAAPGAAPSCLTPRVSATLRAEVASSVSTEMKSPDVSRGFRNASMAPVSMGSSAAASSAESEVCGDTRAHGPPAPSSAISSGTPTTVRVQSAVNMSAEPPRSRPRSNSNIGRAASLSTSGTGTAKELAPKTSGIPSTFVSVSETETSSHLSPVGARATNVHVPTTLDEQSSSVAAEIVARSRATTSSVDSSMTTVAGSRKRKPHELLDAPPKSDAADLCKTPRVPRAEMVPLPLGASKNPPHDLSAGANSEAGPSSGDREPNVIPHTSDVIPNPSSSASSDDSQHLRSISSAEPSTFHSASEDSRPISNSSSTESDPTHSKSKGTPSAVSGKSKIDPATLSAESTHPSHASSDKSNGAPSVSTCNSESVSSTAATDESKGLPSASLGVGLQGASSHDSLESTDACGNFSNRTYAWLEFAINACFELVKVDAFVTRSDLTRALRLYRDVVTDAAKTPSTDAGQKTSSDAGEKASSDAGEKTSSVVSKKRPSDAAENASNDTCQKASSKAGEKESKRISNEEATDDNETGRDGKSPSRGEIKEKVPSDGSEKTRSSSNESVRSGGDVGSKAKAASGVVCGRTGDANIPLRVGSGVGSGVDASSSSSSCGASSSSGASSSGVTRRRRLRVAPIDLAVFVLRARGVECREATLHRQGHRRPKSKLPNVYAASEAVFLPEFLDFDVQRHGMVIHKTWSGSRRSASVYLPTGKCRHVNEPDGELSALIGAPFAVSQQTGVGVVRAFHVTRAEIASAPTAQTASTENGGTRSSLPQANTGPPTTKTLEAEANTGGSVKVKPSLLARLPERAFDELLSPLPDEEQTPEDENEAPVYRYTRMSTMSNDRNPRFKPKIYALEQDGTSVRSEVRYVAGALYRRFRLTKSSSQGQASRLYEYALADRIEKGFVVDESTTDRPSQPRVLTDDEIMATYPRVPTRPTDEEAADVPEGWSRHSEVEGCFADAALYIFMKRQHEARIQPSEGALRRHFKVGSERSRSAVHRFVDEVHRLKVAPKNGKEMPFKCEFDINRPHFPNERNCVVSAMKGLGLPVCDTVLSEYPTSSELIAYCKRAGQFVKKFRNTPIKMVYKLPAGLFLVFVHSPMYMIERCFAVVKTSKDEGWIHDSGLKHAVKFSREGVQCLSSEGRLDCVLVLSPPPLPPTPKKLKRNATCDVPEHQPLPQKQKRKATCGVPEHQPLQQKQKKKATCDVPEPPPPPQKQKKKATCDVPEPPLPEKLKTKATCDVPRACPATARAARAEKRQHKKFKSLLQSHRQAGR